VITIVNYARTAFIVQVTALHPTATTKATDFRLERDKESCDMKDINIVYLENAMKQERN
jgi:hypothetical protein